MAMLAVSERVTGPGAVTERLIWHKPVGPDPDAIFQRIACSDEDGIVMSSGKREVPLKLDKPSEAWCPECLTIARVNEKKARS
ncbi:hypothetical protein AB0I84_35595 [Streptomyces spectabilis]|uniref:hypothetical protein n=1 Tax=Streptomyces spectabilis TaxID=68270 RepID=UPI0033C8F1BA